MLKDFQLRSGDFVWRINRWIWKNQRPKMLPPGQMVMKFDKCHCFRYKSIIKSIG